MDTGIKCVLNLWQIINYYFVRCAGRKTQSKPKMNYGNFVSKFYIQLYKVMYFRCVYGILDFSSYCDAMSKHI